MDDKIYLDFIRKAVSTDGVKVADRANKMAFSKALITQAQYSKAARIIAKAYLARV